MIFYMYKMFLLIMWLLLLRILLCYKDGCHGLKIACLVMETTLMGPYNIIQNIANV